MSVVLTINGATYDYPETGDQRWGPDATDWAVAVTSGMLQKAGGLFQLLAEVDFGSSYGVKTLYIKSRATNPASAGQIRLGNAETVAWRNAANGADISLKINASDRLEVGGVNIPTASSTDTLTNKTINAPDNTITNIADANIAAAAAIAFSKLAALTSAQILVGSAGNVATSVAVTGDITISNGGVTAIGSNKVTNAMLATVATATFKGRTTAGTGNAEDLTATQATALLNNLVGDSGSGGTKGLAPAPAAGDAALSKFLKADGTWATPAGGGDVVGPASATNNGFVRFDGTTGKLIKNSAATITNADVIAAAGIVYSKLTLTDGIVNADINSSAAIAYSKLNLSGGIVNADVNAAAAIAYSKLNLSASIVNADVASGAAIAVNKLAAVTASRALVSDSSGFVSAATTTDTEIGYVNGVTSAIQTQLNTKQLRSTLTTKGDLYVATASDTVARQGVGGNGTSLRADSAQTNGLLWLYNNLSAKTGNYTAVLTDNFLTGDSSGGTFTFTLPTAVGITGKQYSFKKTDTSVTEITIDGNGSETIDGQTTTTIDTQFECLTIVSNGANWLIVDRRIPSAWVAFTPTGTWSTNTTYTGMWRRVGDSMELNYYITLAGAPTATLLNLNLPTGYTIDTAKLLSSTARRERLGLGVIFDSPGAYYAATVDYASSTALGVWAMAADASTVYAADVSNTAPITFASGDSLNFKCLVPIVSWKG